MSAEHFNLEAELSLLGAMFFGRRYADFAMLHLDGSEFYSEPHQWIFTAMKALRDAEQDVDLVSVKYELERAGHLSEMGGDLYLMQAMDATPSPANLDTYITIVRSEFVRRETLSKLKAAAKLIEDRVPLPDLRESIWSIPEGLEGRGQWYFAPGETPIPDRSRQGVPSWLRGLNSKTVCGGWPTEHINIVAALKKAGKTAFMLEDLIHQVSDPFCDQSCLFVSLELNQWQLEQRLSKMLCGMANLPDAPTFDQLQNWDKTREQINNFRYGLIKPEPPYYVEDICRMIESKAEPDLRVVYVDYLQKLRSRAKLRERRFEVEEISARLSNLAQRLKVPIIIGSQVNEGGGTKESTRPEEDCGLMIRLSRPETSYKLEIVYSRFGVGGVEIPIEWKKEFTRFTEPEK